VSLVAIVARDLIIATRIAEAARAAGHEASRVDDPASLPPAESVSVAFVDWGAREDPWPGQLHAWRSSAPPDASPRLVVFGPHTDIAAHRAARAAGLGPMIARSKLVADLAGFLPSPQVAR
jgi:hypothetical protein